jgi:hypothetical protein
VSATARRLLAVATLAAAFATAAPAHAALCDVTDCWPYRLACSMVDCSLPCPQVLPDVRCP